MYDIILTLSYKTMKWYKIPPFILQKTIWIPTRIILFFFGNLEIRGLENLQGIKSNVIFASNHSSEIDPFIVPASLPMWSRFSPLFYATREKSFYTRSGWRKHLFGGWFINLWGGYTVYSGLHDYEKSLKDHIAMIKDGSCFYVFPEGGITSDGSIQKGRGGVAYLAEVVKCPVVPVGISGVYKTKIKDFLLGRRNIIVNFGAPIHLPIASITNTSIINGHERNKYQLEADYIMSKIGILTEDKYAKELSNEFETATSLT
jgi:1-acyl-sn-glycerol-3-phosphate acyltransferase